MRKKKNGGTMLFAVVLCLLLAAAATAVWLMRGNASPAPEGGGEEAPDTAPPYSSGTDSPENGRTAAAQQTEDDGPAEGTIVDPRVVYGYEQMVSDIAELEKKYPELISSYVIGSSVDGRDIPAFNLGRGKREVIICAAMHACEHITANFVMYMTESYCEGYRRDDSYNGLSYREILDNVKFIIVPMVNPDGVSLAQFGLETAADPESVIAISGENYDYSGWKANVRGVDLNANFPWKWGERDGITQPCSAGYSGPSALSEPEAQAMARLMDSSDYYLLSSLHIRGEVIYWLDTDTGHLYSSFYPIARRFADAFGFKLLDPEDVTDRGGYMVNSERAMKGKYGMTVEMCAYAYSDPYPVSRFDIDAQKVYPMGLIMGDEAMKMEPLSMKPDIILNGKVLALYGREPEMKDGYLTTEAFGFLKLCGIRYEWDPVAETLILKRGEKRATLDAEGSITDESGTVLVRQAPVSYTDKVLTIPPLPLLEALGADVSWDEEKLNLTVNTDN